MKKTLLILAVGSLVVWPLACGKNLTPTALAPVAVVPLATPTITNIPVNTPIPSWKNVGSAGFTAGTATYECLAFNNGTPYVAYSDNTTFPTGKANVMMYTGAGTTGWVTVGTGGPSASDAYFESLAFNNGNPYVAYDDGSNAGKATVMMCSGGSWVPVGNRGFSTASVNSISLAFNNGTPYVAYQDEGTSPIGKATVMMYTGGGSTGWVTVGSQGFSPNTATSLSLAFYNGVPYVAFSDGGTSPAGQATVMAFNGSVWVTVGAEGFSSTGGRTSYESLAFNNSGVPYVAFDGPAPDAMYFNGNNWLTAGTGVSNFGTNVSLAFNGNTPAVACVDANNGNYASVYAFNGNIWEAVGKPGFSAGQVSYTSLAYNNGVPYVAYEDESSSPSKATVMAYH